MAAPKQTSVKLSSTSEIKALSYKESKEILFMGTITAPVYEPEDRSSRAPIDLVAVIDRSGSMEGEKLKLVCQTLEFLLQQLKEDDRLSLVTYDTQVAVDFKLMKMTASNKQTATTLIKQLKAGSSTNLSGGLLEGLNQMVLRQDSKEKRSEIASVLLFTDGLANHGITKTADIVRAAENYLAKITGACSIFTFGYGSDHDAAMLKGIAESGKGLYYYIENADDIPESFADCIGGLLSVVAQNISLVVEPMNDVVIQEVLTHYKNTKEGNKFTITFGDLYSEETRNIMCKAVVPAIAKKDDEFDSLKFTLSYFNVLSASPESVSSIATLQRPDTTPTEQPTNPLLENQRNRIETASVIKNAKANADKGELDKAKEQIKTVMSKIQSTSTSNDSYSKALLDDLQEAVDGMADKTEYFSKGQKKMAWKSQAHEQERAVGKGGYETKAKKEMKEKAAVSIPKKS